MVTFAALRAADFSALRAAADAWARLPAVLSGAGGVRQDWERVRTGLGGSGWEGEAARAAAPAMDVISRQFDAAGEEAHATGKLLDDAHHRFTAAQRTLNALVEEINAPGGPFTVDDSGRISPRGPACTAEPPAAAADALRRMDDYHRRIAGALREAAEADEALHWALHQDRNGAADAGFETDAVSSVDSAEQGVARARADGRAAARLAGRAEDLTAGGVEQLNALLSGHAGDPEFAAAFATSLTPRGVLEMWARFSDPFSRTHDVDPKAVRALQANLSRTLGDATRCHSAAMAAWERGMSAEGGRPIEVYGGPGPSHPLGFQVMGGLLHDGTFDAGFLERYGDALLATDQRVTAADPAGWSRFGAVNGLDPQGCGDPVTGLMDALGRSPRASVAFMRQADHFRYLAHDRPWLDDASGRTAFGRALTSATTGHPADVPAGAGTPAHSAAQAGLMKRIVAYYAADGADAVKGPMAKALGRMAAEYLPDFDRCLAGRTTTATSALLPGPGAATGLTDQVAATRFLYTVAGDPAGYAAISLGQARYSADLIGHDVSHPGALPGFDLRTEVGEVARRGAAVQEVVDRGRADAVVDGAVRSDASYNRALARGIEWTKATAGAAAGITADAITDNPFTGPYVEKAVETGAGDLLDFMTADLPHDSTGPADHDAVRIMQESMDRFKDAVSAATRSHGTPAQQASIDVGLSSGFDSGQDDGARLYDDDLRKHGTG